MHSPPLRLRTSKAIFRDQPAMCESIITVLILFKGRGRGKGGLTEQPKRDKSPQQTLPPKQTSKGMSCHNKVALVV